MPHHRPDVGGPINRWKAPAAISQDNEPSTAVVDAPALTFLSGTKLICDKLEDLAKERWRFACNERRHHCAGERDVAGIGIDYPVLKRVPVQLCRAFQVAGCRFAFVSRGKTFALTLRRKFTIGA